MSSLQVDSGQVLREGTEGQNWQFPPRRHFSAENEEAEMQAWQFHGSCRLPLHLGYPGHQDLSCLLRIAQSCLGGILLLGDRTQHCGRWGKYKIRHGSVFHFVWIATRKWRHAVNTSVYSLWPLVLRRVVVSGHALAQSCGLFSPGGNDGSHSPFITWKGGMHLCPRPDRERHT